MIVREECLAETGAILNEKHLPLVEDVRAKLPAIQADLDFFGPIIPVQDVPLLHACLYLREQFKAGKPVDALKSQIVRVYGARGRNFSNLCSAEYLSIWFRPMYEELLKAFPDNPTHATQKFREVYGLVLRDLPWTEFVCSRASKAKIIANIVSKMQRNLQNGVRFLNLHGIGEDNGKKILAVLPAIERETGAVSVKVERDTTTTFVRLEIPEARQ